MQNYITRILSALSQFMNVLFLNGHPNESISGRAYRENWKVRYLINLSFFWQNNHCRGAYNKDVVWAIKYLNDPQKVGE